MPRLCTARGGQTVAFKNTTLKIIFFGFQSSESPQQGPPKINWKPSDTYHALHFITESITVCFLHWTEHTHGKSRGGNSNAIWITLCLIACLCLCLFQTGRWRWQRRAWNFAPWGPGRCLGSWLFSTTAPGPPLSKVSSHRHTFTRSFSAEDYRFRTLQHIRGRESESERGILL